MSKNKIHDLIMIILGNFVVACSVSFFILPNNILTGGVAGVAVALHPVLPIDTVLMIDGLTIGLFILGALLPVFRGLHHECLEAILRKS